MEMRNGMLGVVIVALALTGALFGGYLAGAHAETHDVTKYNYLADISGLFEYDQSPQYISFDPSSNYTGYYSDNTYSTSLTPPGYYFDQDKVGFVKNVNSQGNTQVNNYMITQNRVISGDLSTDLTSLTIDNSTTGTWIVNYRYTDTPASVSWNGTPPTMADVLDAMELTASNMSVRISLGNADWDLETADQDNNRVFGNIMIVPKAWYNTIGGREWAYIVSPNQDIQYFSNLYPNTTFYYPYQSFEIDLASKTVKGYLNDDFTRYDGKNWNTSDVLVLFGPNNATASKLILSNDMGYNTITNNEPIYLNPNYGVWMKEAMA